MNEREKTQCQEIETALLRLYRSPEQLQTFQVLQAGFSGAIIYRLQLADEDLVLKITRMSSKRYVQERAHREISFYLTLASYLPLRVPHVVASMQDAQGFALLLASYSPSPPASEWQELLYLEAARQLGQFHATFFDKTTQLEQYSWLRKNQSASSVLQVQQAIAQWQALEENSLFQATIPPERYRTVLRLLPIVASRKSLFNSIPLTLCHGDCHRENVLRDEQGELIWADWQEVCIGPGHVDLSFFCQRAFKAGGAVPFEAMYSIYHQQLVAKMNEHIPIALFNKEMNAIELQAWLFNWPSYLAYESPELLLKLLNRIELLASRLQL